ncbi:WSC domain-containing protein [Rutstroemia sp. NJR-2017a WRK4]|nr:WSC domain-containing protein [Rutstroemia sp. NJR-2017a WRK4]
MARARALAFWRVQMLAGLFLLFTSFALAQTSSGTSVGISSSTGTSTSASSTSTSTQTAAAVPGSSNYEYLGCYNETTLVNNTAGLRALNDGPREAMDIMTVEMCLRFCKGYGLKYAGLEYTRECYCSRYLSVFSVPVPESQCDLACLGNSSQLCGGALRLSLYQAKSDAKALAPIGQGGVKSKAVLALGVAFIALMVIC